MGWCSGTQVFDNVVAALVDKSVSKEECIKNLIGALEDMDWDCQQDSDYYEHPLVRKAFKAIHPDWFEEVKA